MRFYLIAYLLFLGLPSWACTSKPVAGIDLRTGTHFSSPTPLSSKGLVVIFLSAKCPCSRSHENAIDKLAKEFSEFSFVGVHSNSDEDEGLAGLHFKEAGFSFPVISDKQAKIANELGALKTPHAFIVGPKGECWFNGGVDDTNDGSKAKNNYLKDALSDIREGKEPRKKTARTLGCVIKR